MSPEDARDCQRIYEQRGYIVISSSEELLIGAITPAISDGTNVDDVMVRVIAETDRADFVEQGRLAGRVVWLNPKVVPWYYRVITE